MPCLFRWIDRTLCTTRGQVRFVRILDDAKPDADYDKNMVINDSRAALFARQA